MHRTRMLSCICIKLLPLANEVWGKVIFLHLFVILFTGGGSASVHAGIPTPPRPCTHAPSPGPCTPPGPCTITPRHRACWEIRSTRGRYASYWNAILFPYYLIGRNPSTTRLITFSGACDNDTVSIWGILLVVHWEVVH